MISTKEMLFNFLLTILLAIAIMFVSPETPIGIVQLTGIIFFLYTNLCCRLNTIYETIRGH
jgi:hypothetical protein